MLNDIMRQTSSVLQLQSREEKQLVLIAAGTAICLTCEDSLKQRKHEVMKWRAMNEGPVCCGASP
eukprot:1166631-Amphidinium_carterae.1